MRKSAATLLALLMISPSYAEFFSNIGDGADITEASATVFDALSNIFLGLSILERQRLDSSGEPLNAAMAQLDEAISKFRSLSESDDLKEVVIDGSTVTEQQQAFLESAQIPQPNSAADLLNGTASVLTNLFNSLKAFQEDRSIENYSAMRREIERALSFGQIASEIARKIGR